MVHMTTAEYISDNLYFFVFVLFMLGFLLTFSVLIDHRSWKLPNVAVLDITCGRGRVNSHKDIN